MAATLSKLNGAAPFGAGWLRDLMQQFLDSARFRVIDRGDDGFTPARALKTWAIGAGFVFSIVVGAGDMVMTSSFDTHSARRVAGFHLEALAPGGDVDQNGKFLGFRTVFNRCQALSEIHAVVSGKISTRASFLRPVSTAAASEMADQRLDDIADACTLEMA